ncbi:IS66 family insertion sequence element accessory protein TnpB [Corallococcus sp. BB11-1]|uniref:IS66 family insertion sequence element accessory protein TnpB n=1 Tax=Corallococcus sp. BB11-1 TaxID=2996783 RepID=UPI003B641F00
MDVVSVIVAGAKPALLVLPGQRALLHPAVAAQPFLGLCAWAGDAWGEDVYSGHLFAFVSRRGDRIKVLTWSRGGFVLLYKRLETGRFRLPRVEAEAKAVQLDSTQLAMLLDGIDVAQVKRQPAWTPPGRTGS